MRDDKYQLWLEETGNPIAAAICYAADRFAALHDHEHLSHAICMGIRHGLFGFSADANASIESLRPEGDE